MINILNWIETVKATGLHCDSPMCLYTVDILVQNFSKTFQYLFWEGVNVKEFLYAVGIQLWHFEKLTFLNNRRWIIFNVISGSLTIGV